MRSSRNKQFYQEGQEGQEEWGAWGSVPNNLASQEVPETDRALEIKLIWHSSVLDTITTTDQPVVTIGDEPKTQGVGSAKELRAMRHRSAEPWFAGAVVPYRRLAESAGCDLRHQYSR